MSQPAVGLRVRIASKTWEAQDIASFELLPVDGPTLPAFSAGAHIDVQLADGLTRQYSLCNDPAEVHRYRIAVLREAQSRGGSQAMHALQEGDELHIGAPRNHFALVPGARRSLLLAGGIGVTPILCMARHLAATGADFEMHYCSRTRARTAFVDDIGASAFASQVHLHFDDGDVAQKLQLPALLGRQAPATHLYVCGPRGFMDAVLAAARARGWPEDHLHWEFFAADAVKTDQDGSFEVRLARSGRVVVVARHQTVVQALAQAGVEVPTSCEQGVCGTCLTRVIAGEPEHRDMVLTPAEQAANTQFLPCCSRSRTPVLVLDL
jgi:vanillate O-demethylase ferredoxin subunit